MVNAVHFNFPFLKQPVNDGVFLYTNSVSRQIVGLVLPVLDVRIQIVWDVLIQRSAAENIQGLVPVANSKDRRLALNSVFQQKEITLIPFRTLLTKVRRYVGMVVLRIDVGEAAG